ncbi:heavy-metal-associated domain-containing protein [Lutibacter citreus]|uniref:heavy-metal-associated domain-containing protein n=1 Tax=Lutibacter citreus TaxID=2138210 RepID=UPI000DBE02FF|nr:heavy-metal-associated domain-containing protein [Lutibacter citreus]
MKKLVILLVFFVGALSYSQNKNARTSFEVDGVCLMCKERIEKACIKTKGVKSAVWNVKTHELSLIFDERKTDVKSIKNSVANVGHDMKDLKASDEAYNGLHNCCKYRDEEVIEDHKDE